MSPAFTREQAGQPDMNAPTNPYANRQDVRRMILERMGGRDPFSHDYMGESQKGFYGKLPEIFAYAFRGSGITYDQLVNGTLDPQAKAYWNKVVAEYSKSEQAAAVDQQRRDMQLYTKMAQEFETDRRQHNADYWRANPTEAQIRQVQMGVLKEAERMTGEQLKKLPKDMNGNPVKPGKDKDGKDAMIPMSPQEIDQFQAKAMERNIEQIANYTGTMKYMPKDMQQAFAVKKEARGITSEIAKEWSEGKASLKSVYDRLNAMPNDQMKMAVIENIRGSGKEGALLAEALRQHQVQINNGKEDTSPFASITNKNLNKLEEIIEGEKPSFRKSASKGIQDATMGVIDMFTGKKGERQAQMEGAGETPDIFGQPQESMIQEQGNGIWDTLKKLLGDGGAAASNIGPTAAGEFGRDIAMKGAGPEAMNVLESGWNLAKSMFTPSEAQAADFNPAMMNRSPSMPEPIGPAPVQPGDWRSMMQTMEGAYDPNPAASFVPAGGPADAPVFNRYDDASNALFGG